MIVTNLLIYLELSKPVSIHNRCGSELCLIESKAIIESAEIVFHSILNNTFQI